MKIKVKVFNESNNPLPKYATIGDAGLDIAASEDTEIGAGKVVAVKTGLYFELPVGYELQIRPRSGLSLKTDLRIANSPGTLDSGYVGELMILLWNTGNVSTKVNSGDRIAQIVLKEVPQLEWVDVVSKDELLSSGRGANGFGSSGIKS